MPPTRPSSNRSWLRSPLKTEAGTLKLAGAIEDIPGISRQSMRILGSYALAYMADGNGYYADESGRSCALEPGDAIIVFPEIAHAYGPDPDASWTQIYVVFEGPQFELLRAASILDPTRPVWHLEPVDYWRRRLEEIFQTPTPQGDATALRAFGRFVHLLTDMTATDSEANRGSEGAWLDDSMHLLSEPRTRGWLSPQDVATRVGLSYENFRKLFVRRVGESPAKFQKRRRIEHACAAIYQETATFKELAEELGFCDVYHFSKVFRQIMEKAPPPSAKKPEAGSVRCAARRSASVGGSQRTSQNGRWDNGRYLIHTQVASVVPTDTPTDTPPPKWPLGQRPLLRNSDERLTT